MRQFKSYPIYINDNANFESERMAVRNKAIDNQDWAKLDGLDNFGAAAEALELENNQDSKSRIFEGTVEQQLSTIA